MLAYAVSWGSAIFALAVLGVRSVVSLLAEWQRRETLVALTKDAKPGTVIEQGRGRGGPAMRIQVSCEPKEPIIRAVVDDAENSAQSGGPGGRAVQRGVPGSLPICTPRSEGKPI